MSGGCIVLSQELASIVEAESRDCDCTLLSGGIDTSFVTLASGRGYRMPAFTVDMGGSDAGYARLAVSKLGTPLHVVIRPRMREILDSVAWVVSTFKTVDPVEIAADTVHRLALARASELGCGCVLSGDGGDEMFLGYSFLLNMEPGEARQWQMNMASRGRMPTIEVGNALGLQVVAPLFSWEARRLALEAPLECLIGRWPGKGLLRLYLERRGLAEIARRDKNPGHQRLRVSRSSQVYGGG